ncbi:MAG: bifunctional folylpolyglutamate synthase/dihydrofolate synthase [Chloracidobacterium sp.]|nr:bifunctional folylpolyglutamate synthase/dihydrofolate synthase [Chloracidobacterium sp.]
MNFREAESYLLSLGNEVETMKLGLDNVRRLLTELGDPQNNYLKVQIAGTNGKGSVCVFLRSICLEAGIKAGVYTSPHLISITERINIGGVDIGEEDFARLATRVRETSEKLSANNEIDNTPTFFEQVTAIALLAFAEANVQLAILETGLGGRLDATTAASAEIAAITRIDIDHQEHLGETIEEIAAEKAAIIHPKTHFLAIAEQSSEPNNVILDRCREVGVKPYFTDFVEIRETKTSLCFQTDLTDYEVDRLGLAGRHQIGNAKVAILVAEELVPRFNILRADIILGLKNASHPGRLEHIGNILLDGAHNVGGAKALAAYLSEFELGPITLVFGAMNDKNVAEMLLILAPFAENFVLTQSSNARALSCDELLAQMPSDITPVRISKANTVAEALDRAREITSGDGVVLVAGSLYLVGEARRILIEQSEI